MADPIPLPGDIPPHYFRGGSFLATGQLEAMLNAQGARTRIVHSPIATGGRGRVQPAAGPDPIVIGPWLGLEYGTPASDALYSEFKVDDAHDGVYAALHIHWTKSANTDQSDNVVRWQMEYRQVDGVTQDMNGGSSTTVTVDDTYVDAGTTSRIMYRSSDVPVTLTPGYYFGCKVTVVGGSTTVVNPVLVSTDLRCSHEINR